MLKLKRVLPTPIVRSSQDKSSRFAFCHLLCVLTCTTELNFLHTVRTWTWWRIGKTHLFISFHENFWNNAIFCLRQGLDCLRRGAHSATWWAVGKHCEARCPAAALREPSQQGSRKRDAEKPGAWQPIAAGSAGGEARILFVSMHGTWNSLSSSYNCMTCFREVAQNLAQHLKLAKVCNDLIV